MDLLHCREAGTTVCDSTAPRGRPWMTRGIAALLGSAWVVGSRLAFAVDATLAGVAGR